MRRPAGPIRPRRTPGFSRTGALALSLVMLAACSPGASTATPPRPAPPAATPTAAAYPLLASPEPRPTQSIEPTPPPWAHLNLAGSIVFTQGRLGITRLDLKTGQRSTPFAPPVQGWMTSASVSPDGGLIVMAYAPPPPPGQVQLGYTDLFVLPADGSAPPQALLERSEPQESFFSPVWAPDGRSIYFAHFASLDLAATPPPVAPFKYTIERLPYPRPEGQAPEVIVENGFWPSLSGDGSRLAYVQLDSQNPLLNDLYLAGADGEGAAPVIPPQTFDAVDSPIFSPDGAALIFSAVGEGPQQSAPSLAWLDRLLGAVPVHASATAHNVPSDWWRVPVAGGEPERLTRIYDTGLFGDFAPDGAHIAFISQTGLYVMNPDGSDITPLLNVETFGTMDWVP